MAEHLNHQLQLQHMIERTLANFKKLGKNNLTAAIIRQRMTTLDKNWGQFLAGHAKLVTLVALENRPTLEYFRDDSFDATEEAFQEALDYMAECLEDLEPAVKPASSGEATSVSSPGHSHSNCSRASPSALSVDQLPSINLPSFDGSPEHWETFRDTFVALISNNRDLKDFARMHYLMSCLTGRARECLRSIPITAENFKPAWDRLVSRFESVRRMLNVHISSLSELAVISRESAAELASLRDAVKLSISSLENLNRTPEQLWSDVLVHMVVSKLDATTRRAWSAKLGDDDTPPSFATLDKFLSARVRALEDCAPSSGGKSKSASSKTVSAATASASAVSACPLCHAHHYFNSCATFTRSSPAQRRDLVKKHRRCFNCLSAKHAVKDCKSKFSCRVCRGKHHTMLHSGLDSGVSDVPSGPCASTAAVSPPSTQSSMPSLAPSEVQSLLASTGRRKYSQVLLATAWVTVSVPSGRAVSVRALLDQGSEVTFIAESVAQVLRAKRIRMPVTIAAVGGVHAGTSRHATEISVSPRNAFTPSVATRALILGTLTTYAPKRVADLTSLSHLTGLQWADSDPMSSAPISLIIGADLYSDVILEGLCRGSVGQAVAQNSIFGWVISGPIASSSCASAHPLAATHLSVHHCLTAPSLEDEIHRFWEIEEVPRRAILSEEDEKCERHFCSTHTRAADGRYVVRLPFAKDTPIDIGDSRRKAEKLLASLSRRLMSNSQCRLEYVEFLAEYANLGHMRKTSSAPEPLSQVVYIPHHPVIRAGSSTTHLRVVFNASSITTNGSSLNDHLLTGPVLQPDLSAVLLKWRRFKYVYAADIAKMYRQILLDSRDINYQRILWNPNDQAPPLEYQLLTVTYGMRCAPFLALRVIKQLEADEGSHFPLAASILRDHIYVDDVLFGGNDPVELRQTRDQLVTLLRRGGFELRKWASNSSALVSDISSANHGLACKQLSSDEQLKILGLGWNPSRDAFQFSVTLSDRTPESKRAILSAIAKLYDPLGWVTPVTIAAKIFMQHLWREKLQWDDVVPSSLLTRWQKIYSNLSSLNSIQFSRWTADGDDTANLELHGFADASNLAYAAVVYLRVVSLSGHVTITLLIGKSKVAPLNPLSVPRLELSAAVLLARLLEFVIRTLSLDNVPCFCWTDSTVALAWLHQHPSKWKTFVANRVADVQTRLPKAEWRHVATADNPADCASRGLLGIEILNHSLWWRGPSWLQQTPDAWPHSEARLPVDVSLEEKHVSVHCTQPTTKCELTSRWSSWPKLIRVTAYIFRFIALCRRSTVVIPASDHSGLALTEPECSASRAFWLKQIQAELFPEELNALKRTLPLPAKSAILALRPVLDADGIIRVGGRLRHAPMPFAMRQPILLAAHPLVLLIIDQAHKRALHAGTQLTLSTLRREFWVLRARTLVKAIIHKCVVCTRERAGTPSQLMGDLPAVRVTAPTRSFLHCGLDYAGPLLVRASAGRGIASRKSYVALFVCLATRAIHLELVSDYSTAAFMNAFARFCARRGLPQSVYSDNGTTFVGADRELAEAYRIAIHDPNFQNSTVGDGIAWRFIPPSAPHFGGIWEAGVRSVKHHLRRVVGTHTLTFEELTTLLCKIEACLNSRPIAPLSDSIDDCNALTPGHFLIGSALTAHPEPSLLDLNENRLSRWQLVRQITERFWKTWYVDYVNTLQQRSKWRTQSPSVKPGRLVLLRNPTLPPCKWELGRVTHCHPGADGLTRVVTVRTATSEFKRPIVKLCLLPVDCDSTTH